MSDKRRADAAAKVSAARGNAGGVAEGAKRRDAGARGSAEKGKSYNCPGEDTGYDFQELDEVKR